MSATRPLPLRNLAHALVLRPSASMEQLAQSIGVSRATLHRMVASRDDLLYQVHLLAIECCQRAFDNSGLDTDPIAEVLPRLLAELRPDASLFLFLNLQGRTCRNAEIIERISADWQVQRQRLTGFFERGQANGEIRADLSASWLVDALSGLVNAASAAIHDGHLSADAFETSILAVLTRGILESPLSPE